MADQWFIEARMIDFSIKSYEKIDTLGNLLLTTVKFECPVDTGNLRDSHYKETTSSVDLITTSVCSDVDYCIDVNMGTHKEQGNPYMMNALNSSSMQDTGSMSNNQVKKLITGTKRNIRNKKFWSTRG
jgi:hypothetical protein